MKEQVVSDALADFRESLQADGADLEITNITGEQLDLKITTTDETCLDCLMPKEVIHRIIKNQLEKKGVHFTEISLDCPVI